ncbi:hypothetical protein [Flavobacterium davisii]|uniref:Uncharacterized protein n=1 Tax=Flavobacterium columnare TaxID=996 RepID=A0A8G0P849_9FLAO|nr:hypothetical protein [Flavobacterium davisii]QYS89609.1 hypothetical protein JJC05_04920 [Flavobacterium davisii]
MIKFYKSNISYIEDITKVISGEINEIDSLYTNMVEFWIKQKETRIRNYLFEDVPEIFITTEEFLSFFIEQKAFVESFTKKSLLDLIECALNKIKSNPQYDENNYYYTWEDYKGQNIYICSLITKTNQRATKEEVLKMDVKKVISEIEIDNDFFGW